MSRSLWGGAGVCQKVIRPNCLSENMCKYAEMTPANVFELAKWLCPLWCCLPDFKRVGRYRALPWESWGFDRISSVPWEELSACHRPQCCYLDMHEQPKLFLPFLSFHHLLPFCALSSSLWYFLSPSEYLARKTHMWKSLLVPWCNGPLFISILPLGFLTQRVWGPDGTNNAALELKAGPCLL